MSENSAWTGESFHRSRKVESTVRLKDLGGQEWRRWAGVTFPDPGGLGRALLRGAEGTPEGVCKERNMSCKALQEDKPDRGGSAGGQEGESRVGRPCRGHSGH